MDHRPGALTVLLWAAAQALAAGDPLATAFAGDRPAAWADALQAHIRDAGLDRTARDLAPWLDDRRDGVALLTWSVVAEHRPSATAVARAMTRGPLRVRAARSLPGIAKPGMAACLATAAGDRDPGVAVPALAALPFAGPSEAGQAAARRALGAGDAAMRARAADWFRWHGIRADLADLERPRERDPTVAAVLAAARHVIQLGPAAATAPVAGPAPWFRYGEGRDDRAHRAAADLAEALMAARRVSAPPITGGATVAEPVPGFAADPPGSFGRRVGEGAFAGGVHLGHDTRWHQPGAPVRAVLAGTVRVARPALPSWGGLVVVEHDGPDGPVCSLYGHLGLLLAVAEGDRITAGQLLGTLGRSMSPENGGYGTHRHLGLRQGPYGDGGWVCGYLRDRTPAEAGWLDPVPTIARWRGLR